MADNAILNLTPLTAPEAGVVGLLAEA